MERIEWFAGIFDGEGCVNIYVNRGKYYELRIEVTNTELEIIAPFIARFEGSFSTSSRHSPSNGKDIYQWKLANKQAAAFLRAVLPHLRSAKKSKAAKLAIDFQDQKGKFDGRSAPSDYHARQRQFYLALKTINKRGRA